ncbi:putative endonuclease [Oikeobacillus pervagus]|uniref:Endonuclease n=1 Tax=Oikeobacillus pervagus TaxID=1325931 RepID=A0AAJ1WK73_9BACI|nr:GIY-YIG nuclease family protein [Oikeobacillus pervagus]MDQ0216213.1 putative endonuclease [Oikeobacillus pervagus]
METNKNEHYFYVLECSDGTYYGGYSTDVNRRIEQHNNGKGAKYTRGRTPVKLLYSESFEEKGDALRAEISFKKLSRQQKEYFLQERRSEN